MPGIFGKWQLFFVNAMAYIWGHLLVPNPSCDWVRISFHFERHHNNLLMFGGEVRLETQLGGLGTWLFCIHNNVFEYRLPSVNFSEVEFECKSHVFSSVHGCGDECETCSFGNGKQGSKICEQHQRLDDSQGNWVLSLIWHHQLDSNFPCWIFW